MHQFNLADNHTMTPELPLILLSHVDLDTEFFFVQKDLLVEHFTIFYLYVAK